jgi:hypothetical protein
MNVAELQTELRTRAAEAGTTPAAERLTGLRRRRRARRVRTAGAAVLATTGVVIGVILVPALDRGATVQPAAWRVAIAPDDAGDPLVASRRTRGEPLELRFTPADADLSFTAYCVGTAAAGASLHATVSVNGHEMATSGCSADAKPTTTRAYGDDRVTNRARWAELGVVPGAETVVRIGFIGRGHVEEAGVAIYRRSGERVVSDGAVLRQRLPHGGRVYRLEHYETRTLAEGRGPLAVDLPPASGGPGVLVAGLDDTGEDAGEVRTTVTVDGVLQMSSEISGVFKQYRPTRPDQVVVSVGDRPAQGTLVVAYYTAENP